MSKYTAGIDIGGTVVKCGVTDEHGALLWVRECDTAGVPEQTISQAADLVREAAQTFEISSVGAACAGSVDPSAGIVLSSDNLRWYQVPLAALLHERLQLPVRVENDAQAALLGEMRYGACQGMENVVYITLGTGIGGALLMNGQPYRGMHHCGAEIGHMITHAGGAPCSCGMRGCFEVYASASALVRHARKAIPVTDGSLTARDVVNAARAGQGVAWQAFEAYLEDLCAGLISLMSLFYPEAIVLGGGLSNAGSFLLDGIFACLRREKAYLNYYTSIDILLATHGNSSGVIGAAALFQ